MLCTGGLRLFLLVRAGQSPEVLVIVTAVSKTDSERTRGAEMLNKNALFLPGFWSNVLFTLLNEVTEVTRSGRGRRSPACMCSGVPRPCKTERDPHAPRCYPNRTSSRTTAWPPPARTVHQAPDHCHRPQPSQARQEEAPLRGGRKQASTATRSRSFLGKTSACTVRASEQRPFLFFLVRKAH